MVRRMAFLTAFLLLSVPAVSRAQDASSGTIAGVLRDQAGAVLPGVTVEASSPALIERTRTTGTDVGGALDAERAAPAGRGHAGGGRAARAAARCGAGGRGAGAEAAGHPAAAGDRRQGSAGERADTAPLAVDVGIGFAALV